MTMTPLPSQRFTKAQRLLTATEFRQVFDAPSRKLHQAHLMAFIRPNELDHARVGMAVTKRKVPTAVIRNKIKRHIREQFRKQSEQLESIDIVFIVKKSVDDLSNKELDFQINAIFKKLRK